MVMDAAQASMILRPFINEAEARENLRKPFGGDDGLYGTDGHTLAFARCDGWEGAVRSDAPHVRTIAEGKPRKVGVVQAGDLDLLRSLPRTLYWVATFSRDSAHLRALKLLKKKSTRIVEQTSLLWGAQCGLRALPYLTEPVCINVEYLLRCFDFLSTVHVDVYHDGDHRNPIYFTPAGPEFVSFDATHFERWCLAMPVMP